MKLFKYLLFSFCFFFISCSKDDPIETRGNVYGRTTEDVSNQSITSVQVSISGNQQTISTGQDGSYQFSDLTAGSYSITASKTGYLTDVKNVTIVPGETSNGDFSLEKELPTINPTSVTLDNETTEITLQLENTRSSVMNFTTEISKDWLDISPVNSSIGPLNTKLITLTADLTNVSYGNYEEVLIINVGQASLNVPITINYIEPPSINITNPNTDETFVMGQVMPISWNSNLEGNVKIELYKFSSVELVISEEETNDSGGSYSWEIPALEETSYQITVTSIENENISNTSEPFNIIEGPTKPTVVNGNVTELLSTSLKIEGEITNIGLQTSQVDQFGHVYSQNNTNPTIADFKTNLGSTSTPLAYESEITGLNPAVTYYVNAYATNSLGTSYGEVITVTPPAGLPVVTTTNLSNITINSAETGGNVVSDGGNNLTQRGICWGTTSPVNIDSNTIQDGQNIEGSFTTNLTSLNPATTYYVRAYAINSEGVGYGDQISFTTSSVEPSVETISVISENSNTISVIGNVSDNGGDDLISYGFVYSEGNSTPTLDNSILEIGQNTLGEFNGQISDLQPSTNYSIRAYASNQIGTTYGNVLNVETDEGIYFNITSPSLNEEIDVNITYSIEWNSNLDNEQIVVQHYRGNQFISDLGSTNSSTNSFQWEIDPELLSNSNNKIKILNNSNLEIIAESEIFTINEYLQIISPSENQNFLNNNLRISFSSNYSSNFSIELYNGSQFIEQLENSVSSSSNFSNSYDVSNLTLGSDYRIKLIDNNSNNFIFSNYFNLIDSVYIDERDGNSYNLVSIGNQIWMSEDLRLSNPSGAQINWFEETSDGSYLYHPSFLGSEVDGDNNLYVGGTLAPDGWRVATDLDWQILEMELGMSSSSVTQYGDRVVGEVGLKLKSTQFGGTNSYGFNINGFNGGSDPKLYMVNHASVNQGGMTGIVRRFSFSDDGVGRYLTYQGDLPYTPNYITPSGTGGGYHVRLIKE